MKKYINTISYALIVLVSVLSLGSCANDDSLGGGELSRLFRPILRSPLSATENTVTVNLSNFKDAVSYKVEVSSDNFVADIVTIESVDPLVIFKNLEWNTIYKVRAISIAADPSKNSKVADLGSITTALFPSILKVILPKNIVDSQVRVEWNITGNPVTTIKIYTAASLPKLTPQTVLAATPVKSVANDVPSTGSKKITGLTPATNYVAAVYSDGVLRGFGTFTTGAPISTLNAIDLRDDPTYTDGSDLVTRITDALAAGKNLILDGSKSYSMSGNVVIDKSIRIISGYDLDTGGATISTGGRYFDITPGVRIDLISFEGVKIIGNTGGGFFYTATTNTTANPRDVGTIKFLNCKIDSSQGLGRMRNFGTIDNWIIEGCVVSNIGSRGLYQQDNNQSMFAKNYILKNSTFYKVAYGLANSSSNTTDASGNVIIDACTFSESFNSANLVNFGSNANITSLTLTNNIFAAGFGAPFVIRMLSKAAATTVNTNNWDTNDVTYSQTNPGIANHYTNTAANLFVDIVNLNFSIKDGSFQGRSTAGDPRWRL